MALKLVDLECVKCGKQFVDCYVDSASPPAPPEETLTDPCGVLHQNQAAGEKCNAFKVVISVPRHSRHSSWEVR